ncbi:MAG: M3 family metallopeptidase [Mariprofundaceae bacterium]|nr:M3 family metallopeptidase [Mariprofundaceae bacterium]
MSTQQNNPLLAGMGSPLPLFDQILPQHVLPALDHVLQQQRERIQILITQKNPSWNSFVVPLEEMDEELSRVWGPVTHLNAVCDSEDLRLVYQEGVQKNAAWHTEMAQNEALYTGLKYIEENQSDSLNDAQKELLKQSIRDFKLSGAELSGEAKQRFKVIRLRLSELATLFEQHVLDATRAFTLHIENESDLAGLPESACEAAAQRASENNQGGWLFTLDVPSYLPLMQYSEKPKLRETMYRAYCTRATSAELDNSPVIDALLHLRKEISQLLGFEHYADYSLATKMAENGREVIGFLRELANKSHAMAEHEIKELRDFSKNNLGIDPLQAWDIPFASEKLRMHTYAISQELLKPYFSEAAVVSGMFALVEKIYGIQIRKGKATLWHEDSKYFEVFDKRNEQIAAFYLDPYARAHKRGGAWMDECVVRWQKPDGNLQLPVAYLVCNFDAPIGDKPALWNHDEVMTLFHEFGHGLHHMLTEVNIRRVSGINGVPWDAVELPSQFMENFCWEREVLDLFARHYETGEVIPNDLFERMTAAKNFQSGMQMLRQIELSLFDFLLHSEYQPDGKSRGTQPDKKQNGKSVQGLLDQVREEVAVTIPPAFNKFQNSFSHIFAGGYAAGYYSYKWAEVLSADAYAAFEEEGLTNPVTAARFRKSILAIGGSSNIMDGFIAFRGRKPSVDALLRHSGLGKK